MKVNKHPHIDDNGSSYLFGGKFEEKSIKVTNAKQKSKVLFPGLQSKPAANDQQPFRASSLPQNPSMRRGHRFFLGEDSVEVKLLCLKQSSQQRVEIFIPEIYMHLHPVIKNLISLTNLHKIPTKGRLAFFLGNWSKMTSDTVILDTVKGYQKPFVDLKPYQVSALPSLNMNQEEILLENQEIQELLGEGTVKLSELSSDQFLSSIFLISKKNGGHR